MDLRESRGQGRVDEGEWYDDIRFALLRKILADQEFGSVLDVGCGSAGLSRRLAAWRHCQITAYDPEIGPGEVAQLQGLGLNAVASLTDVPAGSFDLVLLMDVLEHVAEPEPLLIDSASHVAPGGLLVLSVPAYRWLWSSHDEALGHYDRYTVERLEELSQCLHGSFASLAAGYAFPSLLTGAAPVRLLERSRKAYGRRRGTDAAPTSQLTVLSPRTANALRAVGEKDARLVGHRSPFGLTCVQVLRRRGS